MNIKDKNQVQGRDYLWVTKRKRNDIKKGVPGASNAVAANRSMWSKMDMKPIWQNIEIN